MIKVGFLGGRPENGTELPRTEKEVWREFKRVLNEDLNTLSPLLRHPKVKVELCFPLYSKFDIEVLRMTRKFQRPVTFYVPTLNWGLSNLPTHQINLIKNTSAERKIITGSVITRVEEMIKDCDVLYILNNKHQLDRYQHLLAGKKVYYFSSDKMRYLTEEDANKLLADAQKVDISTEENQAKIESFFAI